MKLRVLESRKIYTGKIVDLIVDLVEREDGRQIVREVVRHAGGVVVMGQLDGKILFVRQHRYPPNADLLELPAGKLSAQEDPEVAARREFEEETGYRPAHLRKIGEFFPSPGFCDELLHFYIANGLKRTAQKLEADEDIQVEQYDLQDALRMLGSGEIRDAKTAVGLLWLVLERQMP